MANLKFRVNSKDVEKVIRNTIDYTDGFLEEFKRQESTILRDVMEASIDIFYEDLDQMATSSPNRFHHLYEWDQVGEPSARLVELDAQLKSKVGNIRAFFLESFSLPTNRSDSFGIAPETYEPFSFKAEVMENGSGVIIQPKNFSKLKFSIGENMYYSEKSIFVSNPGGNDVQGSFTAFFKMFFSKNYFVNKVLYSDLNFQKYFSRPVTYEKNYKRAAKGSNARAQGRAAAQEWVLKAGYTMRTTPSGRTQFRGPSGKVVSKDKATKKR
jgi:hypothetical protein